MTKTLCFTILLAVMIACYKDDTMAVNPSGDMPLTKSQGYLAQDDAVKMLYFERMHKITADKAIEIAGRAKTLFDSEGSVASFRSLSVATVIPVTQPSMQRGRSAARDTLMHIVNYSNEGGFAVISADDRDGEIIAYSGNGNFNIEDTAGNAGAKLHLELMLAYQQSKFQRIAEARGRGEYYEGEVILENQAMSDTPPITAFGSAGQPGQPGTPGLPGGHTCKLPGGVCVPTTYTNKYWSGNEYVVNDVKQIYSNEICFGKISSPPSGIKFMNGQPGVGQECTSQPYCHPVIADMEGYYMHYGCTLEASRPTYTTTAQAGPLMKTYWSQDAPLNYGAYSNTGKGPHSAGCGPIAVAQIMAYHKKPLSYYSQHWGKTLNTYFNTTSNLVTNEELNKSPYGDMVGGFVRELGHRMDVTYTQQGSGVVSLITGTQKIQDTFTSFGYTIGEGGAWNYQTTGNFWRVRNSIEEGLPVFIYGFPAAWIFDKLAEGHIWVLDGYRKITKTLLSNKYKFDERGVFNSVENTSVINSYEYVHANMGWGTGSKDLWVDQGVYAFAGTNYSGKIYFIAGIRPPSN